MIFQVVKADLILNSQSYIDANGWVEGIFKRTP